MTMRDTVFCAIPAEADTGAIAAAIHGGSPGAEYVPG